MKKFLLIVIAAVVVAITTQAQVTLKEVNTAVTVTNTTPASTIFTMPQHFPTTQDYKVVISKTSGTQTNVAVKLEGSKFGDTWTAIGSTVNWKLSSADTTIVISNTSENRYRKYKVTFTGTGTGVSSVTYQGLKLYIE